ncbi:LamG-like jellyroll fold domain-containing protein [Pseudomonas orientalis]|uniref:LamG-like jellyroll fold domain-containing protein n=1 Tax=Pseudomonas orientalis TaxID=76758 RepID=UPI002FE0C672
MRSGARTPKRIDGGRLIAAEERQSRASRAAGLAQRSVAESSTLADTTAGACKYAVSVVHQGHVIVLSSIQSDDGAWHIGFTVLLPDAGSDGSGQWTNFKRLVFPTTLRPVGRSVITLDFKPNPVPASDEPFQALSDNQHVYIFRQSSSGTLLVDRFVFDDVLNALTNTWEVRYRRSKKIDIPADKKDTFGSTDMEGDTFIEATTELTPISGVTQGWFTVALTPSGLPGTDRWQIFVYSATSQAMNCFSFARTSDGLFDLTHAPMINGSVVPDCALVLSGTSFSGPPCATVYAKQERLKDEYGRYDLLKKEARLMLAVPTGADFSIATIDFAIDLSGYLPKIAGTGTPPLVALPVAAVATVKSALHFDRFAASSATLPPLPVLTAGALTVECWFKPLTFGQGSDVVLQSGTGESIRFAITLEAGAPTFSVFGTTTVTACGPMLEPGFLVHLACTWDASQAIIYVNGTPFTLKGTAASVAVFSSGYALGGASGFSGDIAELRIWKTSLNQTQILSRMCTSVTSSDTQWADLAGYWPLVEPVGSDIWPTFANAASTGTAADGTLEGALWSASQAPTAQSYAPVTWSADGLTVCTAILPFAKSTVRASLMAGADSQVHLYFSAATGATQMAAHLSTVTSRATFAAAWLAQDPTLSTNSQVGTVRFAARQTGSAMNSTAPSPQRVQIAAGADAAHATVTLKSYTGYTEVWPAVPRAISAFCGVINGNAVQATNGSAPAPQGTLQYDYSAVTVTASGQQSGPVPAPNRGSCLFAVAPDADANNGYVALIQDSPASEPLPLVRAGTDTWWVNDPPQACLALAQPGSMITVLDSNAMATYTGELALTRDMCVETWVNPAAFTISPSSRSVILLFNAGPAQAQYAFGLTGDGQVYAGNDLMVQASKPSIPLSAWTHVAASYRSDYGIALSGERYLDIGNDDSLNTGDALTVEGWIKLDSNAIRQTIASKADEGDVQWELYVDSDGKPAFGVTTNNGTAKKLVTVKASAALDTDKWHHVAGVYDVASEKVGAVQFIAATDGYVSIPALTTPLTTTMTVQLWIKLIQPPTPLQTQIIMQTVNGDDPVVFTLILADNCPVFSINGVNAASSAPLAYDQWTHLSGTYDASTLVLYVDGLLMATAATTNAPSGTPTAAGVAYTVGGTASTNSLNAVVNDVSLWNVALDISTVRHYIRTPLSGGEPGLVGCWTFADRFGTAAMDICGVSNGTLVSASYIQIDKGQFAHRLLIDGTPVVSNPVSNTPALTEDRMQLGSGAKASYFQGVMDAVRLWRVGRMTWEIQYYAVADLQSNLMGLVSDWEFETGAGHVGFDSKSQNNAVIRDANVKLSDESVNAMWVPTQFRSGWHIYINGVEADTQPYSLEPQSFGATQCSIGAMLYNIAVTSYYPGSINELRVWKTQRSGQQICANLNRPLSGVESGLVGYWPFSAGSGQIFSDRTGYGANGIWNGVDDPGWQVSMAPVSNEAPQILNAIGGVAKPSNATAESAPAAAEYGQLIMDASGTPSGVMSRAYAAIRSGTLSLSKDYEVAELLMQYVGQVQTKPNLIGYIEGAPPLPSENLTVDSPITPYKYLAASTVTLTESNDVTYAYSASREIGTSTSMQGRVGLHFLAAESVGIGVESLVFGAETSGGWATALDSSTAWSNDASMSTQSTSTSEKTIEVFGTWETNTYNFDPNVKRIYVPNNKGFALVRSETADLYALRSISSGALVSYSMMPNPDIPADTNIIMFKIDPLYVKNGTLDGYVGFQRDKDYPFLSAGERGSYFKPLEAYALKTLIAREQQQLEAYYQQFDATSLGQGSDIRDESRSLDNLLLNLPGNTALSWDDWKAQVARRSLVNTYVWNSDGGLYSEEEQFSAVREDSGAGTYEQVSKDGFYLEASFNVGPADSVEVLFGSRVSTKSMKSRREATSFGLAVSMPGEGFLNKRAPDSVPTPPPGEYPVAFDDAACPGKVNQYRFMSFYLAPRKKNFEDFHSIVDQNWLNRQGAYAGSYDPDAFALKQALAYPNLVWRVLHRVTYVNRVPLASDPGEAESLPPDIQRPDAQSIATNALMIDSVPLQSNDPTPLATISSELDVLLSQMSQNALYGALVVSNYKAIKSDAMYYMQSYYSIV